MYADPFLSTHDATVAWNSTWTLIQTNPAGTIRKSANWTLGAGPDVMKISHQVVGKGDVTRDRHLMRLEAPSYDGTNVGLGLPLVAYVVWDVPRKNINSTAVATTGAVMTGFLRGVSGNATPNYATTLARFLNGEG